MEKVDQNQKPSLKMIFNDFHHQNPNINKLATLNMIKYYPDYSLEKLIEYLGCDNIELRRKSVKSLSRYGEKVIPPLTQLFFSTDKEIIKICCLKVFVLIASDIEYKVMPNELIKVIDSSLQYEEPQIVLSLICLLRELRNEGIRFLKILAKDKNILKSKASISALSELKDPSIPDYLNSLIADNSIDELSKQAAIDGLKNYA
ncbi:hypothetical protein [Prochlorococcus sp. MIT 1223]|uniref:hypothetical protein n=1 Tax=Prochlorococcus sp. MIT 1223 TaxID=3096217 RepID=UPI002A75FCD2|nr:hypothetical protein [Prochlorococcus sp. MIT 1223]